MPRIRHWLPFSLAAAAALAFCAPSLGAMRVASASRSVWAGARAHATIVVPAGATRCWLDFTQAGRRRQSTSRVAVAGPRISWSWRVLSSSRTGMWGVRAACVTAAATKRTGFGLRVRGGGSRLRLAGRLSVSQAPPLAAPTGPGSSPNAANPFPPGQCTFWAYQKRPDIFDQSSHAVPWDARYWAANARAAGFPVDGAARAGDIAVFQPGAQGAFATGHLAYVEGVNADGSLSVSEMNANGNPNVAYNTRPPAAGNPGIEFIHHR